MFDLAVGILLLLQPVMVTATPVALDLPQIDDTCNLWIGAGKFDSTESYANCMTINDQEVYVTCDHGIETMYTCDDTAETKGCYMTWAEAVGTYEPTCNNGKWKLSTTYSVD